MYGKEPPDCDECVPPLQPYNYETYRWYEKVSRQLITVGMNGTPIDLKHEAVWKILEEYNVPNKVKMFERVMDFARIAIKIRQDDLAGEHDTRQASRDNTLTNEQLEQQVKV